MYGVEDVIPSVVHLRCSTQYELTSTFMRVQEFYESPFLEIRGNVFTTEQFMDVYANNNDGEMSYFTDWSGFNIPGDIVEEFFRKFRYVLTPKELNLERIIDENRQTTRYYLIGSYGEKELNRFDQFVIDHERAHAMFWLDQDYRDEMTRLVNRIRPSLRRELNRKLLERGYTAAVFDDEIQAYMSTGSGFLAPTIRKIAKNLREEIKKYYRTSVDRLSFPV